MIRAVAVDMDGTFLRSDSTYDRPRFMRLVERLREADVRFIAASGNQAARLRHYFEDDPRVSYVAENGHYVYEGATNVPLYAAPPPRGWRPKYRPSFGIRRFPVCGLHAAGRAHAVVGSWNRPGLG